MQLLSLLLSLCVVMAAAAADTDCTASDNAIRDKRAWLCDSLAAADTWWCGSVWALEPKADKDWPNQAVYMQNLLTTLSGTDPACTSSAYYADTIDFLNYNVMAPEISGNFGWTWDVFQVRFCAAHTASAMTCLAYLRVCVLFLVRCCMCLSTSLPFTFTSRPPTPAHDPTLPTGAIL